MFYLGKDCVVSKEFFKEMWQLWCCVNSGPILWGALPCGTAFQPWGQSIWGGERSDGIWLPSSLCWSTQTFICNVFSSCIGLGCCSANELFLNKKLFSRIFHVCVCVCWHRMTKSKQTLVVWKILHEMNPTAPCPFRRPSAPRGNPLWSGIARLAPWR